MKKKTGFISLILVVACAIIAMYMFVDRSDKKQKTSPKSTVDKILARDLTTDYPPTPYSVAEYYCKIVECTYVSKLEEEKLSALVAKERELFDLEFAAINSQDSLLSVTKEELAAAAEVKTVFSGYVLDKASNVERWKKDGEDLASIQLQFATRSKEGSATGYRKLILRKDKEGRYKILGWKTEAGNQTAAK